MSVVPFPSDSVFGPRDIKAMSMAFEDVCGILHLADEAKNDRELVARKIVALAQGGGRNAGLLRDRVLREIADNQGGWSSAAVRAARHGAL
jgi:hypothetical protein